MRLEGKVAVITGAAVGIKGELMNFGGGAGWRFVEEGARVVLTDIDDERGETTAADIREAGGDAMYMHHDVSTEEDWDRVIDATLSRHGKLDVLINNAGGGGGGYEITSDAPVDVFRRWMDVNSTGTFLGIRAAVDPMKAAGGGSIINMSSIYGLIGGPSPPAYLASKGSDSDSVQGHRSAVGPVWHSSQLDTPGVCLHGGHQHEVFRGRRGGRSPCAGAYGPVRHRGRDRLRHGLSGVRRVGLGHRRRIGDRRRADGGVTAVSLIAYHPTGDGVS